MTPLVVTHFKHQPESYFVSHPAIKPERSGVPSFCDTDWPQLLAAHLYWVFFSYFQSSSEVTWHFHLLIDFDRFKVQTLLIGTVVVIFSARDCIKLFEKWVCEVFWESSIQKSPSSSNYLPSPSVETNWDTIHSTWAFLPNELFPFGMEVMCRSLRTWLSHTPPSSPLSLIHSLTHPFLQIFIPIFQFSFPS